MNSIQLILFDKMANHGQELSIKNELYAAGFDKGHLPLPPSKKLIVGKYAEPSNYCV